MAMAAPLRIAAHRDLRGFHQQKAQQSVALLVMWMPKPDLHQNVSFTAN
jgi:hypothetical protein